MKVCTIVGTRPELIRLSRIIPALDKVVNHILIHTGQNYDFELNQIFFNDLEIRKPDYFLNIKNTSVGVAIGDTIIKTEEVLKKEKPDAVLILGDTNSSLSTIISKRLRIPIYHMEAGNRSFDLNVPEEINRKIVDHISDFNLVYTEHARRNLLAEGYPARRIYLTGTPLREVIDYYKPRLKKQSILNKLQIKKNQYFLISVHREENVDNKKNLIAIIKLIEHLQKKFRKKIIITTHPRTREKLNKIGYYKKNKNIIFNKPFGYFEYLTLQLNSFCTISDSGTISEEAAILNFPAITIRNSMERPEAMDCGCITITGFDINTILKAIEITVNPDLSPFKVHCTPYEYNITNTTERVIKLIIGTAKLSNSWSGIIINELT